MRVHSLTIVTETVRPEILHLVASTLSTLPENETLASALTTNQFVRLMQKCPATAALTAHSFKRGAADVLARAVQSGLLDWRMLPLMLKHRDQLYDFPASTLRYLPDPWITARNIGSDKATALL